MARRSPRSLPPLTMPAALEAALRRIAELEARLARLEAQSGQQLPGDFRFEPSPDGASVDVRRVSTGNSAPIVGPL